MAAGINVDGWVEGLDEEGLSDAPFHPIMFGRKNCDIFFTKVMVMLSCMLKHGRFVVAQSIARSGKVLLEASPDRPLGLTDICAWAWCFIGTSARYVVDVSHSLACFEFIFWFDKGFSKASSCCYGGA